MRDYLKFYIDGEWVDPAEGLKKIDVINPATEEVAGHIAMGSKTDVDRAVAAARKAFETWQYSSKEERLALLERILEEYKKRYNDIADAITVEMGAPKWLAQGSQAGIGVGHLTATIKALKAMDLDSDIPGAEILREPVGVCGLITPWNWPINQVTCKVFPAIAAGCTMVLKPSEVAPFDAMIVAECIHAAGAPKGVFNLVNGDGPNVGAPMSGHPELDMISFTGSTRAGVAIAEAAAPSCKRVSQELGGKSPNIILDDADFNKAVPAGVMHVFHNSGQSCNAPTRMLVPQSRMDEVIQIARATADTVKVGDPNEEGVFLGPVVSDLQWGKIQALIQKGIDEGATLVAGGTGKPENLNQGYYVKPTIFANVTNDMTIAQEEIFGPVLSIIGYKDEEDAIRIANDTPYGLAGYIQTGDVARGRRVAKKIRAGMIQVNGADHPLGAPFGGYKMSGNGREWGAWGIHEFQEVKAVAAPAE